MKRDTVNYVMLGAFVVATGVALLVLLYSITGRSGPTDPYYITYKNVGGLKFGTAVYYEGYRVGQVESIQPAGQGAGLNYRVDVSVTEGWQIPADSVASVQASGLISAMTINIAAGESGAVLAPGDEIEGKEQASLFGALGAAAADFRDLSRNGLQPFIKTLTRRVNDLADEYIALRRENLAPLVDRMNEDVTGRIVKLLDRADASIGQLQAILGEENQRNIAGMLGNANSASGKLDELLDGLTETRTELHGAMSELNGMVSTARPKLENSATDLEAAMADLNRVLDSVEQRIDNITHYLETTTRNTSEFSREIRENPSRLLRGTAAPDIIEE
ncbi:MAG: MCE family protein [Gammaproteobacteria bacterium]|nr:MCE family protein [Gammaproteobacteria bacterium]